MRYIDQYKGMTRTVYLVCLTRMLIGMGNMSGAFATLHLRSGLGFPEVSISFIVASQSLMAMVSTLMGGRLADKIGRKKTCLLSTVLASTTYILSYFLCRHKIMALLIVLNQMFANLAYPAFNALIGDNVRGTKMQTEGFSLLYLSGNIGFAIGPSIGGLLYYNHLQLVYILQLGFTVFSAFLFQTLTEETYDPEEARIKALEEMNLTGSGAKEVSILTIFKEHTALPLFMATMALVTMCYQMVNYLLTLQMSDFFGVEIAANYSGFIWTVNAGCVALLTPVLIGYTKKYHQFYNMFIGFLCYAIGFGSYAFLKKPYLFLVFAVIWSMGEIIISTGAGAFIAANSPASHLGTCQSLYEAARYVGRTAGPIFFGALINRGLSYTPLWLIDGGICIILSVFILAMHGVYNKKKES